MEQKSWSGCHPRPQFRRESFLVLDRGWTLNGRPIRAPWPPQAPLAEYDGPVGDELLYETIFSLTEGFAPAGKRVLLHFGAVDQVGEVLVNGRQVAWHEGGYLPFSADITDALRAGENRLTVKAVDRLSLRYPYGKQCKHPHGMWYTPVSGIWQSVWLEAAPEQRAVSALKMTPDLTGVTIEAECGGSYTVTIRLEEGEELVLSGGEGPLRAELPDPHLWTPEDPFLYSMTVTTGTDRVDSYFALRTVTTREINGHTRLCLNGEPVFLHGVLDQGYFEDGLFLPRSPEEYERDVLRMKELGFNTLRKHIKIEPEEFYYACDRLGMLVIQDMVNSGRYNWLIDTKLPNDVTKKRPDRLPGDPVRRAFFERHCRQTLDHLYNHPCIVGYTIFNEGWGQYDSDRIYRALKKEDPTRFFDSTSGWFAQEESDVQSEHIYFRNAVLRAERPGQFLLLSECGGYSRRVAGHVSEQVKNYGYGTADTREALTGQIETLFREMVFPSIPNGLCGCIYTQLSDVEGETNGLYTYDREVCKVDASAMLRIRERLEELWRQVC